MKRSIIAAASVLVITLAVITIVIFLRRQHDLAEDKLLDIQPSSPPLGDIDEVTTDSPESAAFAVVKAMKAGWNLGNTLDSLDHKKRGINSTLQKRTPEVFYETYWGNPVTTPKIIADIAEMGFGAVRVPVTWQDHMDEDFIISRSWLERVGEVVNYVLSNDMYCIINLHHDTGGGSWPWLKADPSRLDEQKKELQIVWTQIAEFFHDYSDKLLFESFNEILDVKGRWSNSTPECYDAVNQLNQVFVDTIRATGGMNSKRFLIVSAYAASINNKILSYFRLPTDTISNQLIASVHTYAPLEFAWHQDKITWADAYSDWDDKKDGRKIEAILESLRNNLLDKGIPVIIGEFGAWNKNNTAARCAYAEFIVREAAKDKITCFWWDEGGSVDIPEDTTGSTLYDRYNERWVFPEIAATLVKTAEEAWANG